jgi:formiminoglutamate deiminase
VPAYWCELAWLGGDTPTAGVVIDVDGERIRAVATAPAPDPRAVRLDGLTLPGLANAHSHAFHRALRGRTHTDGSFWTWRDEMYALAGRLTPETMGALARATFAEMALAGITTVGEFHYLHDGADAMGDALVAAASEAGVRLTLIDACYLHGGIGQPRVGPQRRFGDASVEAWARRAGRRVDADGVRMAAASHSVRAVTPDEMAVVTAWARARQAPLHAHVSEQPAENEQCMAAYGRTPTRVLADAGAFSSPFTAVHATHVDAADIALLGAAGVTVALCPTTERDLADGVGAAAALRCAGCRLALGTDANAMIDLFEEVRAVELDERLVTGRRGVHRVGDLWAAATVDGAAALGWPDVGRLAVGQRADLVTVSFDSVRLAGTPPADALAAVAFAATAADVRTVMVDGRVVVADGHHVAMDVPAELDKALAVLR